MYRIMFYILIFLLISISLFSDGIEPIGSGTETNPYQVETLDNLLWISTNDTSWNKYYIQISDIDASDTQNWNNGAGFSPISFTGSYNGQSHKIQNIYINRSSNAAFFSGCSGEVINLGMENVDITGTYKVGSIVAFMNLGGTIRNCYSTGVVTGDESVGGLVGVMNNWSVIEQSYSNCDVSGNNNTGGVIGFIGLYSDIYNCYSTGTITGGLRTGGFVGSVANNSDIYNCYSIGAVTGGTWTGGFKGGSGAGCIHNCFWDVETSGCSDSNYRFCIGLSTEEMQTYSTFFEAGWDFLDETINGIEDFWGINPEENDGYPFLEWQGYIHNPVYTVDNEIPISKYNLSNYPNPFNPSTSIEFSIQNDSKVELTVFNIKGQKIKTLVQNEFTKGSYSALWNGDDEYGNPASSGIYYYKLNVNGKTEAVKKCLLLK